MAEETVTEEESGPRSQMWKHEAMVAWINEQEGVDLDTLSAAEIIAYAFAKRVAWRKSSTYTDLVASHAAEAEEAKAARAAEREAAAAARKAEKEAAAKAKAEAAEAAKDKEPAKATKATAAKKGAAKKASGTAKKAAAKSDDSPFD